MKKKLLVALAVVLVAVIGGVLALYSSMDKLVASAIRTYGPQIAGVSVRLADVKISPSEGTASLRGLVVGNPEGFETASAMSLGEIAMKLDIASLRSDVVVIREIVIEAPEITYEYASGGSNLDAIRANVARNTSSGTSGGGEPAAGKEPGKKIVIDDLYIRNGKVNVSAAFLEGKAMTVPLPDVHLEGIGRKSNGASAGEVARQVLGSITDGVGNATSAIDFGGAADKVREGVGGAADKIKGLFQ